MFKICILATTLLVYVMSAIDVDWLHPVSPGGLQPLQTLIDWFAVNGVVYHASSHQREVLVPLCRELNARGVHCEVGQILDYVSYLQNVVHTAATSNRALPEELVPFQERLQTLLFKDGHMEDSDAYVGQQKRPTNRLSWLEPSPYGGLSGMEVLIGWLKTNYSVYAHASKKGEKGMMLEELVKKMRDGGIQDCAVNTVRAKIDALHREVKGEKARSAAWEQFGSVLEEIYTVGDACEADKSDDDEEEADVYSSNGAGLKNSSFLDVRGGGATNGLNTLATNHTPRKFSRKMPTCRLSWMKQMLPSSPTAMELLVEWMKKYYARYTQTKKKGEKGRMLIKLLRKITAAGHQGCTMHAIRVKIDSLQRQAGGKARPSSAFDQYGASLKRVFAEKNILDTSESREVSPIHADQDVDDSLDSQELEEVESDHSPEDIALESAQSAENHADHVARATTDQTDQQITERHDMHKVKNITSEEAFTGSDSETEDEREKTGKLKHIDQQISHRISYPSTKEIVRIATLLRERHDLLQRGVSQDQVDKFLPLPSL